MFNIYSGTAPVCADSTYHVPHVVGLVSCWTVCAVDARLTSLVKLARVSTETYLRGNTQFVLPPGVPKRVHGLLMRTLLEPLGSAYCDTVLARVHDEHWYE